MSGRLALLRGVCRAHRCVIARVACTWQPANEIRWKRGELIGKGANGTVYLGLDLRNGRLMAAKEVLAQRATEDRLRALRREIRLLRCAGALRVTHTVPRAPLTAGICALRPAGHCSTPISCGTLAP